MTASGNDVAISAIGMTTPVGLTAAQSCAAVRAGIPAIAELDVVIETESLEHAPINGCSVPATTEGYLGLARWTRLATAALRDLAATSRLTPAELGTSALYLALPPLNRDGVDARLPSLLGLRIGQWLGWRGLEGRVRAYTDGHAAAARAFGDALADLRGGVTARAIVCGVDSLIEPATLRYFLAKRRVKTADHIDGFVPGEAAAALLLEPAAQASARGAQIMAVVEAASTASEPVTIWGDDPSPATGLSEAIRGTLAQLTEPRAPAQLIVCDLNGETYRAKEFGNAAARALSAIPTQWSLWHPADCVGDTGAAAFAVSACVAARALAQGYAKGERALILGSSDDGLRGAVSLRRVPRVEA